MRQSWNNLIEGSQSKLGVIGQSDKYARRSVIWHCTPVTSFVHRMVLRQQIVFEIGCVSFGACARSARKLCWTRFLSIRASVIQDVHIVWFSNITTILRYVDIIFHDTSFECTKKKLLVASSRRRQISISVPRHDCKFGYKVCNSSRMLSADLTSYRAYIIDRCR